MIDERATTPGTRVRLAATSRMLTLRSPLGTIVRPAEWDGYYVVKLDQPASYHHGFGETEELQEVVQAADNMELLSE